MCKKQFLISLAIISFGIVVSLTILLEKKYMETVPQMVSENSILSTAINSMVALKDTGVEMVVKSLGKDVEVKKYRYQDDPNFDLKKLTGVQDSTNADYRAEFYAQKDYAVMKDLMEHPVSDDALYIVAEYEIMYDSAFGIDFPEERRKLLRENHYQMNQKNQEADRLFFEEKKITREEHTMRTQEAFDTYLVDGLKKLLTDEEFKVFWNGKSKDEVNHGFWDFAEARKYLDTHGQ